jgi:phospholipid/cholesterol/gamma-HCH transport system ATP-binding protein
VKAPSDHGIVEVRNLTAGYGPRTIVEDISFQVGPGEVLAILGRSGSGKSTVLKCLVGLMEPQSGEVRIGGRNLAEAFGADRRTLLRQIGVLFQGGALFGSMSVLDNVRLPLEQFTDLPRNAQELVAISALERVGLSDAAHVLPAELSGGMQKRAALARAMALDPRILFLDEPSVGLDPVTSASLDDLIKRLVKTFGITFVIVTHELESLYAVASRAIFIDGHSKKIIAEGTPAELRDRCQNKLVWGFFHREPEPNSQSHHE